MENNNHVALLAQQLIRDQRHDKVYGRITDDETYEIDWGALVLSSEKQEDLTLLRAVLAAQEGLERSGMGGALLPMVRGVELLLQADVSPTEEPKVADAVFELEENKLGNYDIYALLRHLCKSAAAQWRNTPKFALCVQNGLDEALGGVVEDGVWNIHTFRALAYKASPIRLTPAAARGVTLPTPTWEQEDLRVLAGERLGTYRCNAYVVFHVPRFCQELTAYPWGTTFAPPQLLINAGAKSEADVKALQAHVLMELRQRYGSGVHHKTVARLAGDVGQPAAELYVCQRDAITKRLGDEVKVPDHRGTAARKGRKRGAVTKPYEMRGQDLGGVLVHFLRGRVYVDPTSLDAPEVLAPKRTELKFKVFEDRPAIYYHSSPSERTTCCGAPLYTVTACERVAFLVDPERRGAYQAKLARVAELVAVVKDDRAKFDAYFKVRAARRPHLAFTAEQDALIAELWRDSRTPPGNKRRLLAAIPGTPWRRIALRGALLRELRNRGMHRDAADNPVVLGPATVRRYRWAIGGTARV